MKKKIILVIIVLLLITTGCDKLKKAEGKIEQVVENVPLMEFDKYKDLVIDEIKSIQYDRLTEGGKETKEIIDKDEIRSIYNSLKSLKVVKETTRSCEDNTKIYTFNMNNGNTIRLELECDWLVIGNKRYEVK